MSYSKNIILGFNQNTDNSTLNILSEFGKPFFSNILLESNGNIYGNI